MTDCAPIPDFAALSADLIPLDATFEPGPVDARPALDTINARPRFGRYPRPSAALT